MISFSCKNSFVLKEFGKYAKKQNNAYLICNHNVRLGQAAAWLSCDIQSCCSCSVLGNYDLISPGKTGAPRSSSLLSRYSPLLLTNHADTNWLVLRSIHTTRGSFKEESKAEQTVKALKDEVKQKTESKTAASVASAAEKSEEGTSLTPVTPVNKSIKQRVIAELKHYYHGFRLLFIDVKVCCRMLWHVLHGKSLTRRERRQLVRTTADLFRLVPFLVFIIVPFMEFLLPVALKLFPEMLPSTFAEENKKQEKLRKKLKVKLQMAKFLQDTIEETALQRKGAKGESVQEFVNFMERVRTSGQPTTNQEILKYSKLFDEDITLDNLSYGQLRALLKLLDVPAVGTSNFLRFKLRLKMRELAADDKMIMKEGIDSLAIWELQEACRARGMRGLGLPKERLQYQLQQWLDLHLNEKIPTSLLLLSRALYLPQELSTEEQLKATISALPESTAEEAKVKISEVTGDRVDHKTKVELIKQQEEAIKKEKEEEEAKKAEETKKLEELKKKEDELLVDKAVAFKEPPDLLKAAAEPIIPSIADSEPEPRPEEILQDRAEMLTGTEAEAKAAEEEISKEELEKIEDVLEIVAEEKSPTNLELEELEALKEDLSEYKEAIEDLKEVSLAAMGPKQELIESKSAKLLSKKVNSMVEQMAALIADLNKEKSHIIEDIEISEVKMKRNTQLQEDAQLRQNVIDQISEKKRTLVSINELVLAMRKIQKLPDETKLQRVVQVLDEDKDGVIDISDALKVIELLGRENVSVQPEQMTEIMELLQREQQLENEEKLKEKMEKQCKQLAQGEEQLAQSGTVKPTTANSSTKAESSDEQKEQQKQQQ